MRHNQRGLSLISLLIALTIGVFLLAGLFNIWLQTRNTFNAQGSLAQLQDNERIAMMTMANAVQTAGYYPIADNYNASPPSPLLTTTQAFPVAGNFAATGQFVYGSHTSGVNDTLQVRFMSDGSTLDCQGQQQPDRTLVVDEYQIDANGDLQCSVVTSTYGNTTTSSTGYQTIVTGISNLLVYYGVDPGNTQSVTQYMTADQVTTGNDWTTVRSVNLQLKFTNPLASSAALSAGQPLTVPTITRVVALPQQSPL
jgi:type IV pilus assembly protein PilW